MENLEVLLQDNIGVLEKYNIFLDTIRILREVEKEVSYTGYIQRIIPSMEKITETFEREQCFYKEEMRDYIQGYRGFLEEYRKYQVCLLGIPEDCSQVRILLNYDRVHLLGGGISMGIIKNNGYIIVCSPISDEEVKRIEKLGKERVIRYDFLRLCAYRISPETMHVNMGLKQKIKYGIEGVVTGLSYEQRGIKFEKICKNMACLAAPSQDLFLDYHSFLWIYKKLERQKKCQIKYCIIGMDFYRLWYDLSLSSEDKIRMLCFYERTGCTHHYHDMDSMVADYWKYRENCEELMIENYMEKDFCNTFHPECIFIEDKQQYEMTEEAYHRDSEEIKKVFHKPYPITFEENKRILEMFLKFLYLHNIKVLVYIPPFPKIFNEFTSVDMKRTTLDVLSELRKIYEFDMLDLSTNELFSNEHFSDWSHLNSYGANLATELLNSYIGKIWG